jgi:hypothetical protein
VWGVTRFEHVEQQVRHRRNLSGGKCRYEYPLNYPLVIFRHSFVTNVPNCPMVITCPSTLDQATYQCENTHLSDGTGVEIRRVLFSHLGLTSLFMALLVCREQLLDYEEIKQQAEPIR